MIVKGKQFVKAKDQRYIDQTIIKKTVMDFEFSPKWLAVLFVIAGIVVVFMLMGGSLTQLFSSSMQDSVVVQIKEGNTCIVEPPDGIPRTIDNCPYKKGENITINYKPGLPSLEGHKPQNSSIA